MDRNFLIDQINRLRIRFGETAFDTEFVKLVVNEVSTMSEYGFKRSCDIWIGSRTRNKPPLLSEFREARLNEERVKLDNDTRAVSNVLNHPAKFGGLKKYLAANFPEAKTLSKAVEQRREQIILRRRVESNYDPIADKEWMGDHAFPPKDPA